MTVLLARLCVLSLSLFASLSLLINSQTYANPILRSFLTPEECTAPCFMNIQPGVTTAEQARNVLENHQWVKRIFQQPSCLTWEWSGQQPDFMMIANEVGRTPTFNHVCHNADESIIRHVWFAVTGLHAGEIVLINGLPERMYVDVPNRPARYAEVYLAYFRQGIVARTRVQCPIQPERLWYGAVTEIYAVNPLRESPYNQPFDVSTLLANERC